MKDPLLSTHANCVFKSPKEFNKLGSHVKTCETIIVKDKTRKLSCDTGTLPGGNYHWLESHPRHLIENWQDNIDF